MEELKAYFRQKLISQRIKKNFPRVYKMSFMDLLSTSIKIGGKVKR